MKTDDIVKIWKDDANKYRREGRHDMVEWLQSEVANFESIGKEAKKVVRK